MKGGNINIIFNKRIFFWGTLFVFGMLLLRNPYSERTLIGNFEPSPDAFYYGVPALNLAKGLGLTIDRGYGDVGMIVPPLYSLWLSPFYLLKSDPRTYYIANVVLAILSFTVFYKVLLKLTKNKWLVLFGLVLYSTNYYLYWYPQWAMAENLAIFVVNYLLYLFINGRDRNNYAKIGILAASLYGIKYALFPVSIAFVLMTTVAIIASSDRKKKIKILTHLVAFFITISLLLSYQGKSFSVSHLLNSVKSVTNFVLPAKTTQTAVVYGSAYFSFVNFKENLSQYSGFIFGKPTRVLWDTTPAMPLWFAILSAIGLFTGLLQQKKRLFSLLIFAVIWFQVLFISTFYVVDARYVLHAIPPMLFGIIILLDSLFGFTKNRAIKTLICLILVTIYMTPNVVKLKNQVVLNLKYAETPWGQIAIGKVNDYFSKNYNGIQKPVLISPQPPFMFDYYATDRYHILPLSREQEFRNKRELVWGPANYENFVELYKSYLIEKRQVYVSSYGLGNEGYMHEAFNELDKNFALTLVFDGCYSQCKIYFVEMKQI